MPKLKSTDRVFVAGHNGLVGSSIFKTLKSKFSCEIVTKDRSELDLTDASSVEAFFKTEQPTVVFLAAAKVGGIQANNLQPAEFIFENIQIQNNVIWNSYKHGVHRLVFLGSSCIYPKHCVQPMKESDLLSGPLEPTNRPYAVAKIAGLELVESLRRQYGCDYFSVMPTNLYGLHDNFDLETSHVLPALIRKFIVGKELEYPAIELWGSGRPLREFLHASDCADAIVHLASTWEPPRDKTYCSHVNVGSGEEVSIEQLAFMVAETVGYQGKIRWNISVADGTPRKLLDSSILRSTGWSPRLNLKNGIEQLITTLVNGSAVKNWIDYAKNTNS